MWARHQQFSVYKIGRKDRQVTEIILRTNKSADRHSRKLRANFGFDDGIVAQKMRGPAKVAVSLEACLYRYLDTTTTLI